MADDPKPSGSNTALNTAKIAGIVAFLPTVLTELPQNVALPACIAVITCAAITASVPAPLHNRILIFLYQVVRVVGLGVQYAFPYVATHLTKGAVTPASAPLAGPGSVVTIPKDSAK